MESFGDCAPLPRSAGIGHGYNPNRPRAAMLIPADPVNAFVDYPDVAVPNAAAGPLAGLTFAVKDIFDVAGYPTGCGNPVKLRESGAAGAHAPVVARLLAAGA